LGHLNDLVSNLSGDSFATCLYAIYDPTTQVCSYASAGHPPPAVVSPDGTVQFVPLAADPPLGVADLPFGTAGLPLGGDAILVLYTDGLLEAAGRDTDVGMSRLAGLLETHHGEPTDQLCDSLTGALFPLSRRIFDDAALLVAQVHATAPEAVGS